MKGHRGLAMPALMTNSHHIARLAAAGRARIVLVDSPRAVCTVRLDPPKGGAPAWPCNVVALRCIPYDAAVAMRGLIQR